MKKTINALFQAESCLRLLRETNLGAGREEEAMSRIDAALEMIAESKQELLEVSDVRNNAFDVEPRRVRGCHRR